MDVSQTGPPALEGIDVRPVHLALLLDLDRIEDVLSVQAAKPVEVLCGGKNLVTELPNHRLM